MGKQKVKSNQQAMKKLMDKSAAAEPAIGATAWPTEAFVLGADLVHAVRAVAGTEWEAPLSAVVQYLMGLRNSLLAGECALLPHAVMLPVVKRSLLPGVSNATDLLKIEKGGSRVVESVSELAGRPSLTPWAHGLAKNDPCVVPPYRTLSWQRRSLVDENSNPVNRIAPRISGPARYLPIVSPESSANVEESVGPELSSIRGILFKLLCVVEMVDH
jgi:hypothetical protein